MFHLLPSRGKVPGSEEGWVGRVSGLGSHGESDPYGKQGGGEEKKDNVAGGGILLELVEVTKDDTLDVE